MDAFANIAAGKGQTIASTVRMEDALNAEKGEEVSILFMSVRAIQ